jgi:hypothetical protein
VTPISSTRSKTKSINPLITTTTTTTTATTVSGTTTTTTTTATSAQLFRTFNVLTKKAISWNSNLKNEPHRIAQALAEVSTHLDECKQLYDRFAAQTCATELRKQQHRYEAKQNENQLQQQEEAEIQFQSQPLSIASDETTEPNRLETRNDLVNINAGDDDEFNEETISGHRDEFEDEIEPINSEAQMERQGAETDEETDVEEVCKHFTRSLSHSLTLSFIQPFTFLLTLTRISMLMSCNIFFSCLTGYGMDRRKTFSTGTGQQHYQLELHASQTHAGKSI